MSMNIETINGGSIEVGCKDYFFVEPTYNFTFNIPYLVIRQFGCKIKLSDFCHSIWFHLNGGSNLKNLTLIGLSLDEHQAINPRMQIIREVYKLKNKFNGINERVKRYRDESEFIIQSLNDDLLKFKIDLTEGLLIIKPDIKEINSANEGLYTASIDIELSDYHKLIRYILITSALGQKNISIRQLWENIEKLNDENSYSTNTKFY